MASRALARVATSADDYAKVYDRILGGVREKVIIHWLGDMFDPALAGYWGSKNLDAAMDTATAIINGHANKVDGVKISLLDKDREIAMRRRLTDGVLMYTGDDFNYAELIEGDGTHHSHALLGAFTAIAPAAVQALEALAEGDRATYHALLAPTVPLSREIFKAPTRFYKAGIAFLAWLNGAQSHFIMPGGLQSAREITHYAEVFRLADRARLLTRPELAVERMTLLLRLHGIG
jgi:hypothetical protein